MKRAIKLDVVTSGVKVSLFLLCSEADLGILTRLKVGFFLPRDFEVAEVSSITLVDLWQIWNKIMISKII